MSDAIETGKHKLAVLVNSSCSTLKNLLKH